MIITKNSLDNNGTCKDPRTACVQSQFVLFQVSKTTIGMCSTNSSICKVFAYNNGVLGYKNISEAENDCLECFDSQ